MGLERIISYFGGTQLIWQWSIQTRLCPNCHVAILRNWRCEGCSFTTTQAFMENKVKTDLIKRYFRVSEANLAPWFLDLVLKMLYDLEADDTKYYVICGYRSVEEQAKLYSYGRTDMSRKKVTNALPYQSLHNYGLAVDLCRDSNIAREGLQPDWKLESYKPLLRIAPDYGLVSGLSFRIIDGPHIQICSKAGTVDNFKTILENSNIQAVWSYALDNFKKDILLKKLVNT